MKTSCQKEHILPELQLFYVSDEVFEMIREVHRNV
jgi:hypothetical protein